jgi:Ax21 family sulfation-dependent quorum factor
VAAIGLQQRALNFGPCRKSRARSEFSTGLVRGDDASPRPQSWLHKMEITRMKRTVALAALALTAALPFAATAADLDYSYFEAGKTFVEADGGADADGWAAQGSFAITPFLHIYGGYGSSKIDDSNIDADISRLGLGWNTSINETSDLVVRANYLDVDAGFPFGEAEGYEAEVGMRSAWLPKFETYFAAGYADIDRGDGDFYGKLGAQYKFNKMWGVTASATLSDDANEYFIGPRISF